MEPNKFEESLRNKLKKRTVEPSKDAWNRLEERLDASKQKKTTSFFWIGLAASVIGILLVVSQFFNSENIKSVTPVIVETPNVISNDNPKEVIVEETNDKVTLNKSETEKFPLKTYPPEAQQVVKASPYIQEGKTIINNVASVENKDINEKDNQPVILKREALSIEDQKVHDIIAQIKILKENNLTVTDADIEALLQKAQKDIGTQHLYNEKTGMVDAKLLLEDVEAALEKSFRDKVFEALRANFNFVKTAVTQRND